MQCPARPNTVSLAPAFQQATVVPEQSHGMNISNLSTTRLKSWLSARHSSCPVSLISLWPCYQRRCARLVLHGRHHCKPSSASLRHLTRVDDTQEGRLHMSGPVRHGSAPCMPLAEMGLLSDKSFSQDGEKISWPKSGRLVHMQNWSEHVCISRSWRPPTISYHIIAGSATSPRGTAADHS